MGNRKAFERCMGILGDSFDRELQRGREIDARYAYGNVVGAYFLAYCQGIITEQECNRLFDEAKNRFYDTDFSGRR